jgi:hypothetical protein
MGKHPIHLICSKFHSYYYGDYLSNFVSYFRHKDWAIDLLVEKKHLVLNPHAIYFFVGKIPDNLDLSKMRSGRILIINLEQLTINNQDLIRSYQQRQLQVIDYDQFQATKLDMMITYPSIYLPYLPTSEELRDLKHLVHRTDKTHDVVICSIYGSLRRLEIVKQLEQVGLKVLNVGYNMFTDGPESERLKFDKFGHQRDRLIAKGKILINIHYHDRPSIFEHLRCDRWILSGMIIVSEPSLSDQDLDLKDLVYFCQYNQMVGKIQEIINAYPQELKKQHHQLHRLRSTILDQRKSCFHSFTSLLTQ